MYLLKPTLDLYFLGKSKDIMYSLQLSALESTAEFVKQNLRGVPTFKNKYDLLVHAVKSIPDSRRQDLICEFGVFSGKTINCMADQVPNRSLHGFDSFEGIPGKWNFLERGHFKVSSLPSVRKNVTLVKGGSMKLFQNSLRSISKKLRCSTLIRICIAQLQLSSSCLARVLGLVR